MKQKRVVVIGGGLSGLAVAVRLAARGALVTVCEQGQTFGGKMNRWESAGFRFDTGPSLITMPWIFAELFEAAGSRMEDYLRVVPVHPICEYVYPDGTRFTYTASIPDWLETVRQLDRRDVDGFLRFLRLGAQLYELSKDTFLRHRPADWWRQTNPASLRYMPWRYGWGNYNRMVASHFHSPYLRQLYNRYPTYVGSSPYRSPATFALIPYLEYTFGGWYIEGGLYQIVEGLVSLAKEKGATMLLNAPVEQIERSGSRVTGVVLADGSRLPADVVVMNGEAANVRGMLEEKPISTPLAEEERSMSGLVFLFGIRHTQPQLHHHAIFFSEDYHREFQEIFEERRFPTDPTVYLNTASRSDRGVVPGGEGETLFVMANAPACDADLWEADQIAVARQRVMARLRAGGFPDISSEIAVEEVWTPRRIATRYRMPGGAIYGTHSHGWRYAFLRPSNRDTKTQGLYYVGGSTHPGGGTPTVLISARITAELIERDEQ
jgi:phytoene desaturase